MANNQLYIAAGRASTTINDSGYDVFGNTGDETVKIGAGVTGVNLNANVERVQFLGASSDYKFVNSGTNLIVSDSTGAVVSTIGIQDDATGTQLTFANGTVKAAYATTGAGFTVGGTAVPAGTTPSAVTPATIDTTLSSVPLPSFSVAGAASATEGGNALFTVTLANPSATAATTVKYTLATVGTTSSADYGTVSTSVPDTNGTLTFAPGATTATITVPVTFDSLVETGEGVSLTLSNPSAGVVSSTGAVYTTAFADAPAPTFTMTSSATAGGVPTQEGKTITFTVTPTSIVNAATSLSVNLVGSVVGGIAAQTSPADFTAASTLTFAAGDTAAKTVTVTVVSDGVQEGIEGYKAQLLDSSFNEKAAVLGTVTDAIPTVTLSAGSTAINEGAAVILTATSDLAAPAGGLSIPYTLSGTASVTTDYTGSTATTGTISIAAGATTGTLTLNAVADNLTEGAETVIATLGPANGASVNTAPVTVTINDTSLALAATDISLSGAASVNEGSSVTYTVTRGVATGTAVTVPYTLSGTATNLTDYTGSAATTGTITIPANATSGTLTLAVAADSITEGTETVIVTLGTPSAGAVASGLGTVTTTIADTSVAVAGSNFSLTTAVDFVTGTTGNDTIIGDFTSTATLNAGDQINGGAGIDTLKMYGTYAAASVPAGITNTEILDLYIAAAADLDLSAYTKAITGISTVVIENAAAMTSNTVTTTAGQSLSLATGASGVATAGLVTWAASATDASANLTLNSYQGGTGVTAADLTVTGAATTTLNIASTTATNKVSTFIAPATTTSVVVTGDKGLTITALSGGNIAKVDASAATGAVSVNVNATNATFTFLGGTGNDTVTFGATNTFTTADSVVGGAGNDTLEMQRAQAIATTKFTNISGFETLKITNATTASDVIDLDVFGVSNINFKAASTATTTVTNIASGATLTLGATGTTALTIKNDGASDSLKIATSGTSQTYTVTASQFENLTIDTSAGATGTTFALTDAQLKSLTLVNTTSSGTNPDASVNLGTLNAVISTVDLSAFTAATATNGVTVALSGTAVNGATVTGSKNHDAITGSSQVDTIITGVNGADITAGGGADIITLSASIGKTDLLTLAAAADSTQSSYDKVTGFTNSVTSTIADKVDFLGTNLVSADAASGQATGTTNLTAAVTNGFISFGGSAASSLTLTQAILGATTLANALQNSGAGGAGVLNTLAFTFGGDTYVYSSGASNATTDDMMVQLVGLTSATSLSSTASTATAIFIA